MANKKQKINEMLFQQATMSLSDYQTSKLKAPVITEPKEKPTCLRIRPPPLKNMHTLFDWKSCDVPFQLLHKPRPHIDIDPTKPQKPYKIKHNGTRLIDDCQQYILFNKLVFQYKLPDEEKEKARKTRPRLVMTPAFSMDDIENPEARALLVDEMYTSEMMRCTREGSRPYLKVVAPIPDHSANSNPIRLPKVTPPYVSPEWRMETLSWDQKQLRGHCDPTEYFWISSELPPCRACETSNTMNQRNKEMCQMRQERRLQRQN